MTGSAERTRAWRQRAATGRVVALVETTEDDIDLLIQAGLLAPAKADDRGAIAEAVQALLRALRN